MDSAYVAKHSDIRNLGRLTTYDGAYLLGRVGCIGPLQVSWPDDLDVYGVFSSLVVADYCDAIDEAVWPKEGMI